MTPSIRFGRFELLPTERRLLADGQPLALGARAFDVLQVLVEQRGALLSSADLLDRVWPDVVVEESNVQVQVSALRKVLGPQAIATIPGRGYRFAIAVDTPPAAAEPRFEPPAAGVATNVPRAIAPLVGRDDELAALDALLAQHRLVSLVGPGGIGKTRLAQALALQRASAHVQGAWLVTLAALASAERIGPAVAAALRVELRGDSAAATLQLARSLASHDALLVLDNCEHLIDGAAALVHELLAASASLRILVTSQEPLRLAGEQIVRVEALSLPTPGSTLTQAMAHGAMQLLVQRARQADRRFELTPETLEAAIALVRRLDGIPLAIGMAAARLPALGLQALNQRLAERLNWLRSTERGAPARQITLRAALDWSHGLLDGASRAVLRRLSVFAGSFDLERALAVAQSDDLGADAALEALSELVHKSLVGVEVLEPPRYRLLESTRLYATERLAEAGETEASLRRHALAMAQCADQAQQRYWQLADGPWRAQVEPDADDLEAAADRAIAAGDAAVAASTLEALMLLDAQRGVDATRRARMRSALGLLPKASGIARARLAQCVVPHPPIALAEIGRVAAVQAAVDAWRVEGDVQRTYDALTSLGYELGLAGRAREADAAIDEARALERPQWPPRLRQQLASRAGCVAGFAGDVGSYRHHAERALELAEAAGDRGGALRHRLCLVDAALMAGDDAQAIALGHEVVAQLGELDTPSLLATALLNLCAAQMRSGDDAGARCSAARSLPLAWQHEQAGFLVDHLVLLAARQGQADAAAQLAAWSQGWYATHDHQREANEARALSEAGTITRDALGPDGWARAAAQGAALDDAAALRLARTVTGKG